MKIDALLTDKAVLGELGQRMAETRLAANFTQAALAQAAGVSKRTVERLEGGGGAQLINLVRCLRALNRSDGLDRLMPEVPGNPLDLLERRADVSRARARPERPATASKPWTWDDNQ
jgi:transcriptional regulator with XRE-family HTH domain